MGMAIAVSRGGPASVPNVVPLIDVLSGADHNFHGDHAKGADWISDHDPSARATDEAGTGYAKYSNRAGAARWEDHD